MILGGRTVRLLLLSSALLLPKSVQAFCRKCNADTTVCSGAPCPTPEQYSAWEACLREKGIVRVRELNADQQATLKRCEREHEIQARSSEERCRTESALEGTPQDVARLNQCKEKY